MDDLTRKPFDELLDELAARTPTPGGGAAAGGAGALACALGRMVVEYSVSKKTRDENRERLAKAAASLHRFDQLLRATITQDAAAYRKMTELAKRRGESESAEAEYQQSVLRAVGVPIEMLTATVGANEALAEIREISSRYLTSDLVVAAVLLDGAAISAAVTARINIPELSDRAAAERVEASIAALLDRSTKTRRAIEAFAQEQHSG